MLFVSYVTKISFHVLPRKFTTLYLYLST